MAEAESTRMGICCGTYVGSILLSPLCLFLSLVCVSLSIESSKFGWAGPSSSTILCHRKKETIHNIPALLFFPFSLVCVCVFWMFPFRLCLSLLKPDKRLISVSSHLCSSSSSSSTSMLTRCVLLLAVILLERRLLKKGKKQILGVYSNQAG